MFVYINWLFGRGTSQRLFSKVHLGAQSWGGQNGQGTGLGLNHRARKDQDLVRCGATD
jgi:hypothetical protein